MSSLIVKLFKSAALIGVGVGLTVYAPTVMEHLPLPKSMTGKPLEQITEGAPVDLNSKEAPKPPSIRVVAAAEREITQSITATGSIMPRSEALVGTDVAGLVIEELYYDVGDVVKKGDRLARLDRSNLELQMAQIDAQAAQNDANLASAESQTVDAEIAIKEAQEQLNRILPLVKSGVASKAQRDSAQNALASAKAKFSSSQQAALVVKSQAAVLEAQRKQTSLQLEKTELRSPVDGLVLARSAAIGQVVSGANGPLFTVATDRSFELAAEVSEADLARLAQGMDVNITLPGRATPIAGTIRIVSPQVDSKSRLGTVKVTLPKDDGLRNGSFARGVIILDRKRVTAIPGAAVLYKGRDPFVQKIVDGKVISTPVTLGLRDNEFVGIETGLQPGDVVISKAGTFVADGDAVTPVLETVVAGATN
jgi:HlyD family secretion protein